MNEFTLWAAALTVIALLLFGMTYWNWFKTNLTYHRKYAGKGWNAVGVVVFLLGLLFVWLATYEVIRAGWGIAGLALAWLHPVFACGWDFSDIHLPKDKR